MEYTTENTYLKIVKIKNDYTNGDWGAVIKRSLMPSQFYVIEKKPEVTSSFYFSLTEPSAVFTLTKSASKFLMELLLSKVESFDEDLFDKKKMKPSQIGGIIMDDLNMKINLLENRPMWIDDSEIQSVTVLCEKCRRMKEEHHIQFAVIDDFLNMPVPESVQRGLEAPDAAYKQLCQLAKELDIVVVAFIDSSANDINEHH